MKKRFLRPTLAIAGVLCMSLVVAAPAAAAGEGKATHVDPETVWPVTAAEFEEVLHRHHGQVVLVNLWATWCIPCIMELPELAELQERYADQGFKVIGVSLDEPGDLEEKVRPFFAERGAGLVSYLLNESDQQPFVDLLDPDWPGALPTSFFIDRQGKVHETLVGQATFREFEKLLLPLL